MNAAKDLRKVFYNQLMRGIDHNRKKFLLKKKELKKRGYERKTVEYVHYGAKKDIEFYKYYTGQEVDDKLKGWFPHNKKKSEVDVRHNQFADRIKQRPRRDRSIEDFPRENSYNDRTESRSKVCDNDAKNGHCQRNEKSKRDLSRVSYSHQNSRKNRSRSKSSSEKSSAEDRSHHKSIYEKFKQRSLSPEYSSIRKKYYRSLSRSNSNSEDYCRSRYEISKRKIRRRNHSRSSSSSNSDRSYRQERLKNFRRSDRESSSDRNDKKKIRKKRSSKERDSIHTKQVGRFERDFKIRRERWNNKRDHQKSCSSSFDDSEYSSEREDNSKLKVRAGKEKSSMVKVTSSLNALTIDAKKTSKSLDHSEDLDVRGSKASLGRYEKPDYELHSLYNSVNCKNRGQWYCTSRKENRGKMDDHNDAEKVSDRRSESPDKESVRSHRSSKLK